MNFIDFHCDTLLHLKKDGEETLLKNKLAVDFERMKAGGSIAQFFAIFPPPEQGYPPSGLMPFPEHKIDNFIAERIEIFNRDTLASNDVNGAYSFKDLLENKKNNKISAFLTLEDGRRINSSLDKLMDYYNKGIRLITLVWNYKNCIASPNSSEINIMNEGLSDFGKNALEMMNEIGIIIDVSHVSDGGFWDVAQISKRPFVASHSNARAIAPHTRNLSDEMIKAIGDAGGCIGLNFEPMLVYKENINNCSTVEAIVAHGVHIKNKGGIMSLALGSDLDGLFGKTVISEVSLIPLLLDGFKNAGFTENEIEAIAYGNIMRVIKDILVN